MNEKRFEANNRDKTIVISPLSAKMRQQEVMKYYVTLQQQCLRFHKQCERTS